MGFGAGELVQFPFITLKMSVIQPHGKTIYQKNVIKRHY